MLTMYLSILLCFTYISTAKIISPKHELRLPLLTTTVLRDNFGVVKRRFVPATAPRELQVEAVVLHHPRHLGLSVTWQPGEGVRAADSYTLIVNPANKTLEDQEEAYCGIFSYHHDIDAGRTTWLISREEHNDDTFIVLEPECSYSVLLYASPYDGKSGVNLFYTIPRCVGVVCSCRLSKSTLPQASLFPPVPLKSGSFNISWVVKENTDNKTADLQDAHFVISAGPEIFIPFDNRAILYNLVRVANIEWKGRDAIYWTLFTPNVNKTHQVIVKLEDRWNCVGQSTEQIFVVPPSANTHKIEGKEKNVNSYTSINAHVILVVVLPTVLLALIAIIGTAIVTRNCSLLAWIRSKTRMETLPPVKPWRSVYRAVHNARENGRYTLSPGAEEQNVLYVEQEIQEALERGDADKYEVNYNRIHLGKQIGRGAFGRVFLASVDSVGGVPVPQTIAVKKLKQRATPDELDDFLAEIATLKQVGKHPNIVTLIGCCTISQPYCMLMEWIPCGDLLGYLRNLRDQIKKSNILYIEVMPYVPNQAQDKSDSSYVEPTAIKLTCKIKETISNEANIISALPNLPGCSNDINLSSKHTKIKPESSTVCDLNPRELHSFALQIALGMAHLEQKQITHRDLAARNVLIDTTRTLKISDFGLSRPGIYVNTKRRKVPLRWLSIESMTDHLYSSRSDVWAYGIVLWEIGTLGGFPYPTVADMDLLTFIQHGRRLDKPHNCTEELYELMTKCWLAEADERPTFAHICSTLKSSLGRKDIYVDFATLQTKVPFAPLKQVQLSN